jgi:hypothetical protein
MAMLLNPRCLRKSRRSGIELSGAKSLCIEFSGPASKILVRYKNWDIPGQKIDLVVGRLRPH